ncbi:FAD:protein FMN transferase [Omnitrophica bacterium]|nr:FAD:protein FMN transferase [Candidatus Omnitrophota bacterium]
MITRFVILFLALSSAFISAGCGRDVALKESRFIMDTVVNIKVRLSAEDNARQAIEEAFSKMKELERLISKYDEASEVALINRSRADDKIAISPDTALVLKKAKKLAEMTNGAFDITVAPLVDLWNSYKEKNGVPTQDEIERVCLRIGFVNILFEGDRNLRLLRDDIRIDLSGIAKGYVVDEAIKVLKANGIRNGLVDAGGDIFCLGQGPDENGWRIGIRNPRKESLIGTLNLSDKAVATSGDYQRFFVKDKKRYSHIIDPRNGYPVSDTPMSVTVLAPDCITADGLATAISVMGSHDGLKLAEDLEDIEAIIISKQEGTLKIDVTSGVKNFYEKL